MRAAWHAQAARIKTDIFVPTQRRERPEWRRPVFQLYGTRSLLPPLTEAAEEAEAEMQMSESSQKTIAARELSSVQSPTR